METDLSDLHERCVAGDDAAWRELVDRFAPLVYGVAKASGLDIGRRDDVAQTVFTSLVCSVQSIRDPAALPGWILTASRRACWRAGQESVMQTDEGEAEADTSDDLFELAERRAVIRWAVDAMEPPCGPLIEALFFRPVALPYEQIASELGIATGSIGPTRGRCLAKLASLLRRAGI